MRIARDVAKGAAHAAVWPAYVGLAAYTARQAPWTRSVAFPASATLAFLALAFLAANLARAALGPRGWAATAVEMPEAVARQLRRAAIALVVAHVLALIPVYLISNGLIAPGGRPISAPAIVRGLILALEFAVFGLAYSLMRSGSTFIGWLAGMSSPLGAFAKRRRSVAVSVLGAIGGVIALEARGFSFSARRLSTGAAGSVVVAAICYAVYRGLVKIVDAHAWRWIKVGHALAGRPDADGSALPDDLAARLRRLGAYSSVLLGLMMAAWVWDVDLAFFRFVCAQPLWSIAGNVATAAAAPALDAVAVKPAITPIEVTVGDVGQALLILAGCIAAWRHMSTFFAVAVFPRIPDDPGIRFAVVTLCRYAVLGLGLICSLSAVHLGLEKIGVILAALGVGLGFGLQEIVSNFVCGIILLLERPIRVGDVVTVSGMSGKIDRINIRATTIINGDNQSIIVPNRAFITSDLVNWTLKDRVIRVTVKVKVAWGTDPDRVSELLLAIALDDADVLRNPVPAALMEEISDSSLLFSLHAHVPDPSLAGRVKHRLFRQIQARFRDSGIEIPLPTQELRVLGLKGLGFGGSASTVDQRRVDPPSVAPPAPWGSPTRPIPAPLAECHRGVDE